MMSDMNIYDQTFCERVSKVCIAKFNSLGKTGKPVNNEWIIVGCIVKAELKSGQCCLDVVSLGTGSKCIGNSQLPHNGDKLHDSHAEIIARRAFKIYLFEQLKSCLKGKMSIFVLENGEFRLKEHISFHFYCSNVPCGDASIFPKAADLANPLLLSEQKPNKDAFNTDHFSDHRSLNAQSNGDSSADDHENQHPLSEPPLKKMKINDINSINDIYRTGAKCTLNEPFDSKEGGVSYHITGSLRTKPGRGDPTLSHCCSDKIFKWTVLGVQGSLLMLILKAPIYLETITIGKCPFDKGALYRALYSRFEKQLKNMDLVSPFQIKTPILMQATTTFPYSKPVQECSENTKPSPTSIIWSDTSIHKNKSEVSVEGKRLGTSKKNINTRKSRVSICRMELMIKCFELIDLIKKQFSSGDNISNRLQELSSSISTLSTYRDLKDKSIMYKKLWCSLRDCVLTNWTQKPEGLQDFVIDML